MTIRRHYVELAEGQLHYVSSAGHGVPLVFLHQTASSWRMWLKVMQALPLRTPMYAFDTPGFGNSFDPEGATSMPRYADWMAEAFDALQIERAHLIGHHTGAAIAAEIAASRPERVASVTFSGPLTLTPEERAASALLYGAPFVPEPSGRYLMDNFEYLERGGAGADPLLMVREMADMLRAHASRQHAYAAVWNQDFIAAFSAIHCPMAIVCAQDDVLWPYFERARTLRPDALSAVLPDAGSFAPDLVPAQFAAVVRQMVEQHDAAAAAQ